MASQKNSIIDQTIEKIQPLAERVKEKIGAKETIITPEQTAEKFEESGAKMERVQPIEKVGEGGLIGTTQAQAQLKKREEEVEQILSKNMEDIYLSLDPDKQLEFKKTGEETAQKITQLLEKAKISFKKILLLIKKWLLVIPHVNRYFLEQEAKIKTDEIIKLKKEEGK